MLKTALILWSADSRWDHGDHVGDCGCRAPHGLKGSGKSATSGIDAIEIRRDVLDKPPQIRFCLL